MPNGKRKPAASGHFQRYNALVKGGWLRVLSEAEKDLWHAYESFADRDGLAYPDGRTLADMLGHKGTSHIGEIRQSLVRRGLLEIVEAGGGRGHVWKVRLVIPKRAPKPVEPSLFGDEKGSDKREPFETRKVPESGGERFPNNGEKGSRLGGVLNKEEQPIEQPIEQPTPSAAVRRGGRDDEGGVVNAGAPIRNERVARDEQPRGSTGGNGSGKRVAARVGRKLDPEQQATREAFTNWWVSSAWPRRNGGVDYEFGGRQGGRNGRAVMDVLQAKFVDWDLERAKAVAEAFLAERDPWIVGRGFALFDLADRIARYVSLAAGRMRDPSNVPRNGHSRRSAREEEQAALIDRICEEVEAGK